MKIKIYFLLILALPSHISAYEVHTHSRMTQNAFERILQEDDQLINRLGLTLMQNNLGTKYYDVSGSSIYERTKEPYEQDKERMPSTVDPLSTVGWLLRGAIREDDAYGEDNPQDDPNPVNAELKRPLHHFYDPVADCGLYINTCATNYIETGDPYLGWGSQDPNVHKNPDWAIGAADVFADSNTEETNRRNHFTVFDARETLYRALTGKDKNGSKAIFPDGSGGAREPNDDAEAEEMRKAYWATTFRALGDIVHLVQDTGQPQHTRNDPHAGKTPEHITGDESTYEHYINARALGSKTVRVDGRKLTPRPLNYDGYPIPTFGEYSSYWSTREGVANGRGLADYSNRGFFTAGKNLGGNEYASPANNSASYTPEAIGVADKYLFNPLAEINFLRGGVIDA